MTDPGRTRRSRPGGRAGRIALAVVLATSVAACGGMGLGQAGPSEDVRGGYGPEFWWAVGEPTTALGSIEPAAAETLVDDLQAAIEPARDPLFPVSLIATFATADEAQRQADEIRDVLAASAAWYDAPANRAARADRDDEAGHAPLTPPERAVLEANLLAPGERGIGWGGAEEDAGAAVYTIGPVVVVPGLKAIPWEDVEVLHPLVHLLAADGADVLLEGDRSGEGSVIADITCQPADAPSGAALLDELGDAVITAGQFHTRPPWIDPELTAEEALARATYRRYEAAMMSATLDMDMAEYAELYMAASEEERAALTAELGERMKDRGVAEIEGEIDTDVLALILDSGPFGDPEATMAWAERVGATMGQLPLVESEFGRRPALDDYARIAFGGSLRLREGRLEIGWLSFGSVAAGLPLLAGYLTERGCSDIRATLVDFDDVRGD